MKIASLKTVADVSTAHLTIEDAKKLNAGNIVNQIGQHDYGYIVQTFDTDNDDYISDCRKQGMSESYINLMNILYKEGFHYAFLDSDGVVNKDLPVFDW